MTKYYARVGVLVVAVIAGCIATVASSAEPKPPKPGCKGAVIFDALVLNLESQPVPLEVPKSSGRLCREVAKNGNVTLSAKLKIETGRVNPAEWDILLGYQTGGGVLITHMIGSAFTAQGESTLDFEDTICPGHCSFAPTSFTAPFLSAVSKNDTRMYITGFRTP